VAPYTVHVFFSMRLHISFHVLERTVVLVLLVGRASYELTRERRKFNQDIVTAATITNNVRGASRLSKVKLITIISCRCTSAVADGNLRLLVDKGVRNGEAWVSSYVSSPFGAGVGAKTGDPPVAKVVAAAVVDAALSGRRKEEIGANVAAPNETLFALRLIKLKKKRQLDMDWFTQATFDRYLHHPQNCFPR